MRSEDEIESERQALRRLGKRLESASPGGPFDIRCSGGREALAWVLEHGPALSETLRQASEYEGERQMNYTWKGWPEALWIVGITVGSVLVTALLDFDIAQVTDWKEWGQGLGSALVRGLAVGVATAFGIRKVTG